MKRILVYLILCFASIGGFSQGKIIHTDLIVLRGEIKNPQNITMATLAEFKAKDLNDVTNYNHLGEAHGMYKSVKGILLKDVLQKVQLNMTSPKQLYGFYVECTATDGYKTVFTWNELMNTPNGENIFIVTARDGKDMANLDDRIAILQLAEPGKGHLNIKAVQQITILSVK
ncbi:MAG: hypothetical protein ACHQEM_07785 [Chitinophagales bacterium]